MCVLYSLHYIFVSYMLHYLFTYVYKSKGLKEKNHHYIGGTGYRCLQSILCLFHLNFLHHPQ